MSVSVSRRSRDVLASRLGLGAICLGLGLVGLVSGLGPLRLSRVSGASSHRLGNCNVSSRSRLGQNFERLGLGDMSLESRLGLASEGLVHIPGLQ